MGTAVGMPVILGTACARRAALPLAALLTVLLAATAFAAAGGLTQKTGTAGCISEDGSAGGVVGACVDGTALDGATSVAVSPDGTSAYVTSSNFSVNQGVSIFDRNPTTGALTQKTGTAGCISQTGSNGACGSATAIDGARSVTVSPNGASVYVAVFGNNGNNAVVSFERNTTTGVLRSAGCVSDSGHGGACVDGTALNGAFSVTVSPDGTNVYVASLTDDAVAIFNRDTTTGALTQKAGTAGCISETGSAGNGVVGACVDGTGLDNPSSVTVSPDGTSAYVASNFSSAVAVFDRDTTTGALTQKSGTAGCISEDGSAAACVDGVALTGARSVTVSPDGTSAYVASTIGGVAVFDRNLSNGALTQKTGAAGCISPIGRGGGVCPEGSGLEGAFSVTVSPDGTGVYAAAVDDDAVTVFDRNTTTGALVQKPGIAGCISETGSSGACVDGTALDGAISVAVSPDGTGVYVASREGDAVTIFDRDLPPETTIDSGPAEFSTTNDPTPTFTFSSSEPGSSFQCRIDAGALIPCSSPFTLASLVDGAHRFEVGAIDNASNPDPTPASRSFSVNTAVPPPPDPDPDPDPDPALPAPVQGEAVNAVPVSGEVFVKLPGTNAFVRLEDAEQLPTGTIFDLRDGRINLISSAEGDTTRSALFYAGLVKVLQAEKDGAETVVKLVGPLEGCGKRSSEGPIKRQSRAAAIKGRGVWGKGGGGHKSSGKKSSGSVRGTWWLVEDLCSGETRTFVKDGVVSVRDFERRRTVKLRKGEEYLAPGPKRLSD